MLLGIGIITPLRHGIIIWGLMWCFSFGDYTDIGLISPIYKIRVIYDCLSM